MPAAVVLSKDPASNKQCGAGTARRWRGREQKCHAHTGQHDREMDGGNGWISHPKARAKGPSSSTASRPQPLNGGMEPVYTHLGRCPAPTTPLIHSHSDSLQGCQIRTHFASAALPGAP